MNRPTRVDRGASIIELALVIPVMALLVLGVVDLARAYQLQIRLEGAAREGAAYAQLYPHEYSCDGGSRGIRVRVEAEDADLATKDGYGVEVWVDKSDGTTFEVDACDPTVDVDPGDRVRVDVTATHRIVTPLVGNIVGDTMTIDGSTEVEVLG